MRTFTAFLGLALSSACGMSDDDIRKAWGATSGALASGQAQGGSALSTADQAESMSFVYSCAGGGSARFDGSAPSQNEFSFQVAFDACASQGVIIDGDLRFASVATTSSQSASFTFDYEGTLVWSGDVDGECEIDMTGNITASQGGSGGQFTGTICGEDASQVF